MTVNTCKNCVNWTPTIYEYGKCSVIGDVVDVDITYGWDGGHINHFETPENFGCNKFTKNEVKSGIEDANKEIINKKGWK